MWKDVLAVLGFDFESPPDGLIPTPAAWRAEADRQRDSEYRELLRRVRGRMMMTPSFPLVMRATDLPYFTAHRSRVLSELTWKGWSATVTDHGDLIISPKE